MIKKSFAILVLALSSLTAVAQQAPQVIAVNFEELFQGFYEVKEALEKFQTSIDSVNQELQTMASEVQPDREKFEELVAKTRNDTLTEAARQEAQAEAVELQRKLRETEQEFARFQQDQSRELDERRNAIRNQFIIKIREVVSQYAESKGADIVLNTAPQSGAVVYIADSFDMTEEVLEILNADAPAAE